jgi:hypothetical protein
MHRVKAIVFLLFAAPGVLLAQPGWEEIPNTAMRSVCPTFPDGYYGYVGCGAVVGAWSGGAFDTKRNRLILWGGGHADYYGNELYALELNSKPRRIVRLTDPSPFPNPYVTTEVMSDGAPCSRHTYGGIAYIAHADRLFAYGGAKAGNGGGSTLTWTFDFATNRWQNMNPKGTAPGSANFDTIVAAAYDPVTRKVFVRNSSSFASYDYDTNTWTTLKSGDPMSAFQAGDVTDVIDPVRRKFVVVGPGPNGVRVIDLKGSGGYASVPLATTGIYPSHAPGLAYHEPSGLIVAWDGSADTTVPPDTVYTLNLESATWTAYQYPKPPFAPSSRGTFGRWQYSPALDAFVVVNHVDHNAFLFRLPTSLARVGIPLKTWVARSFAAAADAFNAPGSSGKHQRLAHNPVDGLIYFLGGDHAQYDFAPYTMDSGRNEMWTYSIKTDQWAKIQPFCRTDGTVQPARPDQVGWVFDTRRNVFWMVPGYMWGGSLCPNMVQGAIMSYDPLTTKRWTVHGTYGTNQYSVFGTYDHVTDTYIRLYYSGSSGTAVQIYHPNLGTDAAAWEKKSFPSLTVRPELCMPALNAKGRCIYFCTPTVLYRYDIDPRELKAIGTVPAAAMADGGEVTAVWDSISEVLYYIPFVSASDTRATCHIYHPDTKQWETDALYQPDGLAPAGRHAVFDPLENVLMLFGSGDKHLFLYRYGDGPSSKTRPSAPANLSIKK